MARTNFSYDLALDLPKEVVTAHVKNSSAASVNAAIRRAQKLGNTPLADMLSGIRKEMKLTAIIASVNDKTNQGAAA